MKVKKKKTPANRELEKNPVNNVAAAMVYIIHVGMSYRGLGLGLLHSYHNHTSHECAVL